MNKRFSTLLATALVAGSLSAYAATTPAGPGTGDDAVKNGEYTFLYVGGSTNVLTVESNKLTSVVAPTAASTLADVNKALWQVTVIPSGSVAGGNTYSFVNKGTGQALSVVLKSNKKAVAGVALNDAVTVGGTGANATWGWDATNGLYAVKGDSTFTFKAGTAALDMEALHKDATGARTPAVIGHEPLTLEMNLTAADFNALTKGKLYFKGGKDVSTGNTNVLTANTWEAVTAIQKGADNAAFSKAVFSLKNASNKYLVVDTAYYTGTVDALKLAVDTVFAKDYTTELLKDDPASKRAAKSYRFSVDWSVAKDSLIFSMTDVPAKLTTPVGGSNWVGNVAEDNVAGVAIPSQIILRTLANATVLTVEATAKVTGTPAAYVVKPLIQPTAGNIGGIAKITPNKVYYVADMKTHVNGEVNPNNGKFYDGNTANITNALEAGQAFNMFSQFVVTATPGTDKGNYIIKDRVFGETFRSGVADSLANGNIVIEGDTIKLVDANIAYAGKAQNIAFFADDHALKNKQFKIQSASPLLGEEMFIHMKKDSSMSLKAGEIMYNLVRLDTRAYNGAAITDAVDKLNWETYAIKTSKGEYLVLDNNGRYILTADPTKYNYTIGYEYTKETVAKTDGSASFIRTGFTFLPTDAADKFVIVPTFPCVKLESDTKAVDKVVSSYYSIVPKAVDADATQDAAVINETPITSSLKQSMVTVNTNSGDLENEKLGEVKYDLFYVAEEEDPQSLFSMPKHIKMETTNNQFVTVNAKNEALVVAEGALKAGNYTAEDFTFWLDTAKYDRNGGVVVTPDYYVTRGVAADTTNKVDAYRTYMYNAADSAKSATVNKEQYIAYESTRVIFRNAKRFGVDSLIVANGAKQDTLTLDGKAPAGSAIKAPKAGVNNFRFNFVQAKDEAAGVYNIKSGDTYLRNLNGVLVIGKLAEGVMVSVKAAEAPTSNETIDAETVSVIAGDGNVQIQGAQGKKVVVSNILGQTIANTVISSSNATIAVPAGVVVVAVEGEAAVKAIVK